MSLDKLENKGFAFLNTESINKEKRQIIVIGTARGGTSLVSGALHHLGIFTGDKSNPPVFEDVLLSEAFEKNDIALAKNIAEKYTEKYSLWSWKRPAALNYLDKIEDAIKNPFYIFIFKDIFAIANRNNISMQADISKGLSDALSDYAKIVDFASKTKKPIMLISAEKALQNKDDFVDALIEINKDIQDCTSNKKNATDFITPNPTNYLDTTRISKSIGCVDKLTDNEIHGWAKYVYIDSSTEIEVYINKVLKYSTKADIYRDDLVKSGISKNGKNGFIISLKQESIKEGDTVKVKVKNDVHDLKNGVKTF